MSNAQEFLLKESLWKVVNQLLGISSRRIREELSLINSNAMAVDAPLTPQPKPPVNPRRIVHLDKEKKVGTVWFELPGVKKEDIHIMLVDNQLYIRGESKITSGYQVSRNVGFPVHDIYVGEYNEIYSLPYCATKEEGLQFSIEAGILKVTFPLSEPVEPPKEITLP